MLARLGYSVKLCSSSGGTLRSIKHSFLTATRPTPYGGELRSATAACSPPAATCPVCLRRGAVPHPPASVAP